jgi:hypothetical protein
MLIGRTRSGWYRERHSSLGSSSYRTVPPEGEAVLTTYTGRAEEWFSFITFFSFLTWLWLDASRLTTVTLITET